MSRFTIVDAEQRSDAWLAARAGRATGSRAKDILAKIKSGEAAARRDYKMQLVAERLIGAPQEDGYVNKEMLRGIEKEPDAIAAWEASTGLIARRTGFLAMTEYLAGCSVDGDIRDFEGLLEVKAPKTATHLGYLKLRRLPPEYEPQATHNMWVTGAKWLDFCSFDDRLPEDLQLLYVRVYRNELDIEGYESEVLRFLKDVDDEIVAVNRLKGAHGIAA